MTVYVVYREGIYMQGIVGAFDDEARALAAIENAIKLERDDYHDFRVGKFESNKEYAVNADQTGEANYLVNASPPKVKE